MQTDTSLACLDIDSTSTPTDKHGSPNLQHLYGMKLTRWNHKATLALRQTYGSLLMNGISIVIAHHGEGWALTDQTTQWLLAQRFMFLSSEEAAKSCFSKLDKFWAPGREPLLPTKGKRPGDIV
jgi:hypothetical protein